MRAQPSEYGSERERLTAKPDAWVEMLAWVMDRSIPLGPWRIGLDPIIGLVPGFGDYVGGLISMAIVIRAAQVGLPKPAIVRMAANILIETLVGVIPIVGDIFDARFKANTRNVWIFREALQGRRRAVRDWIYLAVIAILLALIALVPLVAAFYVFRFMWNLLGL